MVEAEAGGTGGPLREPDSQRTLVVIPTYNEADNLPAIIKRLRAEVPAVHILVVDDGSPDGTGKIADSIAEADDQVHVLHRSAKAGLGAAYIAGFRKALADGYEIIVEMDADGSHDPEDLPRLLSATAHADLVLGSRWVSGGGVVNWPKKREFLSRGGSLYSRWALGIRIRDVTGGYRAYHRHVLRTIDLDAISSQGYCFQVDLVWRTIQAGFRVVEVPITFVEREHGESKMSGNIVTEALLQVTRWGAQHRVAQFRSVFRKPHNSR